MKQRTGLKTWGTLAPNGYRVNHKDGQKDNNRLSNLEFATPSENTQHYFRTNIFPHQCNRRGSRPVRARRVGTIEWTRCGSVHDAAKESGISRSSVVRVCQGLRSS
eukprot:2151155-Amphidinium_carterae.1